MKKERIVSLTILCTTTIFILTIVGGIWFTNADICSESIAVKTSTIIFSEEGVQPKCSIIVSGSTVTWINEGEDILQVASNPHPQHTANAEISGGQYSIVIKPKQNATVTLTKKGTFFFHDHAQPLLYGKIIIK